MQKGLILLGIIAGIVLVTEVFIISGKQKVIVSTAAEQSPAPAEPVSQAAESVPDNPVPEPPAVHKEIAFDLELLGTLIKGKYPVAFIKDCRSGKSRMCRVGNSIQGARVMEIRKGEVIVEAGDVRKKLVLSGRAPGESLADAPFLETVSSGTMVVKTGELRKAQQKILQELRKIKVRPYYENRKVSGLRVEGIGEDSVIISAGIRNNDVIREVNEQRIDSYQKALQVFLKARKTGEIKVNLVREGRLKQLSYRFQ